jgi:transcriptional antiterminator RfaH
MNEMSRAANLDMQQSFECADASRWLAVHTHARSEHKAALNLRKQGFETYLPQYLRVRRHARRIEQCHAPLFPRYLFARVDLTRQGWRVINSTIGVNHVVSNGSFPAAVPDGLIATIREREDAEGFVRIGRIAPPKPGDVIRIIAGPMIDQAGIFECERERDRVVVLLNLIGTTTRVTISADAVMGCD